MSRPSKGRGFGRQDDSYGGNNRFGLSTDATRSNINLNYAQTRPNLNVCLPPPGFDKPVAFQQNSLSDSINRLSRPQSDNQPIAYNQWGPILQQPNMSSVMSAPPPSAYKNNDSNTNFEYRNPASMCPGRGNPVDAQLDYCSGRAGANSNAAAAYCRQSAGSAWSSFSYDTNSFQNELYQKGPNSSTSSVDKNVELSSSSYCNYAPGGKPAKGRGRSMPPAEPNDFGCSSVGRGCNFGTTGGGFGSGFPDFVPEPEPKQSTNRERSPPKNSGGGFMDWRNIEKEMEQIETAKWAGLPQIKKNFYVECPTIAAMTDKEVEAIRLAKNNITVQDLKLNRVAPKPVLTFEHAFGNNPEILAAIEKQGFIEPSPIQCQMWPVALSGYDVIGIAQTGTGKTLGFLLPIFVHLDNQEISKQEKKGPGCIILSPIRELALQIHSEVKKYRYKKIKSVCLYGGGDRAKQIESCLEGVDIIIATPGRLNDLVCDDVVNLKTITFVVLDEADRMLDMGFEPQIKIILQSIRPDHQTIMTSATWPPEVRRMGSSYTKDPFLVVVGSLDLRACQNVTQVIEIVQEDEKRGRLFNFLKSLKPQEKILVFVGKKSQVDDLASDLARMGVRCQSYHGGRDQSDRERALNALRNGDVKILIATDVASRGLDIIDITHVFNYDFPRHMEEYVHRVGRTGRAGRSGVSVTFVTRYDWRSAGELIKILEEAKQEVPDELRRMAERYEQKLKENPEMGDRRQFYRSRNKQPFFMEDYI